MKPSSSERLSDHLAELDREMLDTAFAVDDPQKLKKYTEANRRNIPFYQKNAFRSLIAAAACLALIIGVLFAVRQQGSTGPDIQIEAPPTGGETAPSESPELTEPPVFDNYDPKDPTNAPKEFKIRNIDMLNYYAAIQVLTENAAQTASVGEDYTLHKLTNRTEETLPADTEGPPIAPPTKPTEPVDGYDKYYYTFEPDMVFYVTRVMFFQIELTNPDGFLASQVGCGTVDVVITNNSIGTMITFKNGDRFYSCLDNGQGQTDIEFSTHIYIEGFAVVKNMDPESYRFTVTFDGNQITGNPQTHIKEMLAVFTMEQLEDYFTKGILPDGIAGM